MPMNTSLVRLRVDMTVNLDVEPKPDGTRTTRDEARRLAVRYLTENPTVLEQCLKIKFRGADARYGETARDE